MTWQELVPVGEKLLPDRPYGEAVDLGTTSKWWSDVAIKLQEENELLRKELQEKERMTRHYKDLYEEFYAAHRERNMFP